MTIRPETAADVEAIQHVHRMAFGREDEARLVDALRDGRYVRAAFVAAEDDTAVGHILFSDLPIQTAQGPVPALALAPLAVLPDRQQRGIGSELVRHGLAACRQDGHRVVVVLGHPDFYARFGFCAKLAVPLESPFAGEAWMATELTPGALAGVAGTVQYPPPFMEMA